MRKTSIIKERILEFLNKKRITKYECYRQTGITNGVFSQSNGMTEDNILKFLNNYTEVSAEWLFRGKGPMTFGESLPIDQMDSSRINATISYRFVPLIDINPVRSTVRNSIEIEVQQHFDAYMPFPEAEEGDVGMYVTRDTMVPTFVAGAMLLLRPVFQWRKFIEFGNIYLIELEDHRRLLREIRPSNESPEDNFLLVAHNPNYAPLEMKKEYITHVWLVRGVYQKMSV